MRRPTLWEKQKNLQPPAQEGWRLRFVVGSDSQGAWIPAWPLWVVGGLWPWQRRNRCGWHQNWSQTAGQSDSFHICLCWRGARLPERWLGSASPDGRCPELWRKGWKQDPKVREGQAGRFLFHKTNHPIVHNDMQSAAINLWREEIIKRGHITALGQRWKKIHTLNEIKLSSQWNSIS